MAEALVEHLVDTLLNNSVRRRRSTRDSDPEFDIENSLHDGGNELKEKHTHEYLLIAGVEGDWSIARDILRRKPECAAHSITTKGETIAHIAASGDNACFLRKVVEKVDASLLMERPNADGYTAFHLAVLSGVVQKAEVMIEKNENMGTVTMTRMTTTETQDDNNHTSVFIEVARRGHRKMVTYLFNTLPLDELCRAGDRVSLLEATIQNNMFDVASKILDEDKSLATTQLEGNQTLLNLLAQKPLPKQETLRAVLLVIDIPTPPLIQAFYNLYKDFSEPFLVEDKILAQRLVKKIWKEYLKLPENELWRIIESTEILHYAAKQGNAEFLKIIFDTRPDLLRVLNKDKQTIFHLAVLHRQKNVLDLIHIYGSFKDFLFDVCDKDKNKILHLTAKLRKTNTSTDNTADATNPDQPIEAVEKDMPRSLLNIPGPALRLQRELLWFMDVGSKVSPSQHMFRNHENKTPKQIFTEDHREMLKEGEKWMKDTADKCMLVATLIATVVFAAAFTVPGGNKDGTGIPIFIKRGNFVAFMVCDALAVISSAVSIILFLSILTSRHREEDFLVSLPLKLYLGLTILIISIVAMLLTFMEAFALIFDKHWHPRDIILSVSLPVGVLLMLNFNLWSDTASSLLLFIKIKFNLVNLELDS